MQNRNATRGGEAARERMPGLLALGNNNEPPTISAGRGRIDELSDKNPKSRLFYNCTGPLGRVGIVVEGVAEHRVGEPHIGVDTPAGGQHHPSTRGEHPRHPLDNRPVVPPLDVEERIPTERGIAELVERERLKAAVQPLRPGEPCAGKSEEFARLVDPDNPMPARKKLLGYRAPGAATEVEQGGARGKLFEEEIEVAALTLGEGGAGTIPLPGDAVVGLLDHSSPDSPPAGTHSASSQLVSENSP